MTITLKSINEIFQIINKKNVKHISFDFWNTLYESNPEFKLKRNELLSNLSNKGSLEVQDIIETKSHVFNSSFSENDHINHDNLIISLLDDLKVEHSYIENIFELFRNNPPKKFPGLNLFFKEISNMGITTSILSNTAYIPGKEIIKVLKADNCLNFFSFLLFSDEMKQGKPNSSVFQKVKDEVKRINTNIQDSEILHVGDDIYFDVTPALKYGFSALKI